GYAVVWRALLVIAVALIVSRLLGRALGLSPGLAALLGIGTAICGGSAIVVTAPIMDADKEDMAYAVTTVFLFGLLAIFIYPLVGGWLDLDASAFGRWAGLAVNDTSSAVATGFAYSAEAGQTATVTKLT